MTTTTPAKTPEQRQIDAQNRPSSNGATHQTQPQVNPEDTRPPGTV